MRGEEKALLKRLCRDGASFEKIRRYMLCCDTTIKSYMKIFAPRNIKQAKKK